MAFLELAFPPQRQFKQQYLINFRWIQNSNLRHFIKHPLIPVGTLPLKPKTQTGFTLSPQIPCQCFQDPLQ